VTRKTRSEDVLLAATLAFGVVRFMATRMPDVTDGRTGITQRQIAALLDAYPQWAGEHPGECPKATELGGERVDGWGHALELSCERGLFSVRSSGEDEIANTPDDLRGAR
jgi:hypothetical protein